MGLLDLYLLRFTDWFCILTLYIRCVMFMSSFIDQHAPSCVYNMQYFFLLILFIACSITVSNTTCLIVIFFSWRYNPQWGLYFTAL